jgi:hypothetical protein
MSQEGIQEQFPVSEESDILLKHQSDMQPIGSCCIFSMSLEGQYCTYNTLLTLYAIGLFH